MGKGWVGCRVGWGRAHCVVTRVLCGVTAFCSDPVCTMHCAQAMHVARYRPLGCADASLGQWRSHIPVWPRRPGGHGADPQLLAGKQARKQCFIRGKSLSDLPGNTACSACLTFLSNSTAAAKTAAPPVSDLSLPAYRASPYE